MSQEKLAEEAGISPSTVYRIEKGKANPTVAVLRAIMGVFGMGIGELFELEGVDLHWREIPWMMSIRRIEAELELLLLELEVGVGREISEEVRLGREHLKLVLKRGLQRLGEDHHES